MWHRKSSTYVCNMQAGLLVAPWESGIYVGELLRNFLFDQLKKGLSSSD